ncbi:hypothetical protein RIF29_17707 [Crotalaria pallida]|uniref:Uncharacterized protein n=1 Tax=Crotalaria pallida TaxID=3830 RepID=A0AAN9IFJ8_CROPI
MPGKECNSTGKGHKLCQKIKQLGRCPLAPPRVNARKQPANLNTATYHMNAECYLLTGLMPRDNKNKHLQ